MSDRLLERFEQGRMTASDPDYLAALYSRGEFTTAEDYAESLPQDAVFVDIGSGLSLLGSRIATARPDIQVKLVDLNYDHPHPTQAEQVTAFRAAQPSNVEIITADALALPESIRQRLQGADVVASYNLITHFLRVRQALGDQALRAVASLARPNGKLIVGPTNARMGSDERWGVAHVQAGTDGISESDLQLASAQLQSPRLANVYYRGATWSGIGLYNTNRFGSGRHDRLPAISDNSGETYHRLYSWRGAWLASRLLLGVVVAAADRFI